jgi:hypothetical protein
MHIIEQVADEVFKLETASLAGRFETMRRIRYPSVVNSGLSAAARAPEIELPVAGEELRDA